MFPLPHGPLSWKVEANADPKKEEWSVIDGHWRVENDNL